jgi:ferredoxin
VIAPVRRGEQFVFAPIAGVDEIAWDCGRPDFSAKDFFFPASEAIVTWQTTEAGVRFETATLARPQVVFGLRPCDAQALSVLDRLFLADPVDLFYAERRAKTTLVGWACTHGPWNGCFCTSVGGGPVERTHLDVLLTPLTADTGFAVDVVSEKGTRLTATAALGPLGERQPAAAPEIPALPIAAAEAWRAQFGDAYWSELAERCLGCRTCTYDCPVCYCFDVRDRRLPDGKIERLRCWDSCQGAQCFAIAGGHNPRPTQQTRLRQRYMHKFLYYPSREQDAYLCVGCGRCVVQCPVNIDIREVLAHVAEAAR